jgi:prepilin-type N-terminal cleavage/methylation domain-containing protein
MKTRSAGFTLLEVLLAVAIFAMGLLATSLVGANALDEADLTEKLLKADFLLRERMEDVVLGRSLHHDGDGGSFDDPALQGFSWRVSIEDIPFLGVSPEDAEEESRTGGSRDPRDRRAAGPRRAAASRPSVPDAAPAGGPGGTRRGISSEGEEEAAVAGMTSSVTKRLRRSGFRRSRSRSPFPSTEARRSCVPRPTFHSRKRKRRMTRRLVRPEARTTARPIVPGTREPEEAIAEEIEMCGSERGRSGFTLVEVLVTIAVVGILMASMMGIFMGTLHTKRRVESARSVYEIGPVILNLVGRDVNAVYFYDLDGEPALAGRNHSVAGREADRLELVTTNDPAQFVEIGRARRRADFGRVTYALRSNPELSGYLMLYRREVPLPDPGDPSASGFTLVYDRVRSFNVVYFSGDPEDPDEGFADWNSSAEGRLPAALRLELEIDVTPQGGLALETGAPQTLRYSRLMMLPPGATRSVSDLEPLAKNLDEIEAEGGEENDAGQQGPGGGRRRDRGRGQNQRRGNNPNDSGLEELFGGNQSR